MKTILYSKLYSKDLASLIKSGKVNTKELDRLIDMLARGDKLDPKYRDHQLSKCSPKPYQGCRDFHYKPNICVVYRLTSDSIELLRIGSHQKLQLTESNNT